MATFSSSQITDLAEILGTSSEILGNHLDVYAEVISEDDKTRVLERVTDYQAVEDKTTSFEPVLKNFGAKKNPATQRSLIKQRIAALLSWKVATSGGLVRG